ncbi:methyl-CpG-binding domain-containing protein 13 [Mercurialis annua]|uniref:methyl-CpG-binding domain-containing protein 13 n=1 Tax=Mercurialis annua TaxID=3986 RepID=UPI00215F84ED|nr:methyl-CpG-binding domain-containing protein 13 [Mercurialis annua]
MKPADSDDDSLPEGWTVKVKVTTAGKKYKCYFPPSGEAKFYSKLQVVRFLNKNNPKSVEKETDIGFLNQTDPKSEKKEEDIEQSSAEKLADEKTEPEGLPPGWTKEIKVTKKGHKVRRDSFYTDPVSGYVFRSMKDALRYLQTGEIGRLAFKPKDKGNDNVELEDDKACTPAAAKKQKLAVNETTSAVISDQPSKVIKVTNVEHIPVSASTAESTLISEIASGAVKASSINSETAEGNSSSQLVGKRDHTESVIVTAVDVLPVEQQSENGGMKSEGTKTGLGKSKKKKDQSLPQRSSKRLAGLALDPTPELKTTNRACRAGVVQSSDVVACTDESSLHTELEKCASDTSKNAKNVASSPLNPTPELNTTNRARQAAGEQSNDLVACTGETSAHAKEEVNHPCDASKDMKRLVGLQLDPTTKLKATNRAQPKQSNDLIASTDDSSSLTKQEAKDASDSPKNSRRYESHKGKFPVGHMPAPNAVKTENKTDEKHESSTISSSRNITIREAHTDKKETSTNPDEKPGGSFDQSLGELWQDPCIAFAIKTLTGISFENQESAQASSGSNNSEVAGLATLADNTRKENFRNLSNIAIMEEHAREIDVRDKEKLGSTLNMSLTDAWADPCIEFAIKTLTGAIPLDCDMLIQDCLQRKTSSSSQSQSQESSGLTSRNAGEPDETRLFCQQFNISEQLILNQEALPQTSNVNLRYSGGTTVNKMTKETKKSRGR